jgi:hypothetical protein
MSDRLVHIDPESRDLVMRFPLNWRAMIFFGTLAVLHMTNAVSAVWNSRIEGELSVIFAVAFVLLTAVACLWRTELAICTSAGQMRLRTRLGRIWSERSIPFDHVHAVRLFLSEDGRRRDSHMEILCAGESIDCPPSQVPRQQALCLAMAMGVELIKVCYEPPDGSAGRLDGLPQGQKPITPDD